MHFLATPGLFPIQPTWSITQSLLKQNITNISKRKIHFLLRGLKKKYFSEERTPYGFREHREGHKWYNVSLV